MPAAELKERAQQASTQVRASGCGPTLRDCRPLAETRRRPPVPCRCRTTFSRAGIVTLAQRMPASGPRRQWGPNSLGVDVLVEVVGQPSVPAAQVSQEPCWPGFRLLAHSLHHQGDVKDQNRGRPRCEGWEPMRHVGYLTRFGQFECRRLLELRPPPKAGWSPA